MCEENKIELDNCLAEDDPVEFLHQHRAEILKTYSTYEALRGYYSQFSSADAALAILQARMDAKQP